MESLRSNALQKLSDYIFTELMSREYTAVRQLGIKTVLEQNIAAMNQWLNRQKLSNLQSDEFEQVLQRVTNRYQEFQNNAVIMNQELQLFTRRHQQIPALTRFTRSSYKTQDSITYEIPYQLMYQLLGRQMPANLTYQFFVLQKIVFNFTARNKYIPNICDYYSQSYGKNLSIVGFTEYNSQRDKQINCDQYNCQKYQAVERDNFYDPRYQRDQSKEMNLLLFLFHPQAQNVQQILQFSNSQQQIEEKSFQRCPKLSQWNDYSTDISPINQEEYDYSRSHQIESLKYEQNKIFYWQGDQMMPDQNNFNEINIYGDGQLFGYLIGGIDCQYTYCDILEFLSLYSI